MNARGRARHVVGRGRNLAHRVASGVGLVEIVHLRRRVDALDVAIAENSSLAVLLTEQVAALEQRLVEPLEHRHRQLDET